MSHEPCCQPKPQLQSTQPTTHTKSEGSPKMSLLMPITARGTSDGSTATGHSREVIPLTARLTDEDISRNPQRSDPCPQVHLLSWIDNGHSRRVRYVRRTKQNRGSREENTLGRESHFFREIEEHKNKRLERICTCPVTRTLLLKERLEVAKFLLLRILRGFMVFCCPPLCYTLPRIAFWPPSVEYYFFHEIPGARKRLAPDLEKASNDTEVTCLLKSQQRKLYTCCPEAMNQVWRVGMIHECASDIEGAEGFVVKTAYSNYIAGVYIKCRKKTAKYHILYSHPNASDISDHLNGVPNLRDMARVYHCDVYAYDYSGFGISTGSASEKNQNADIRAIYDYMTRVKKIPSDKIILLGYSIGTSASIDLASTLKDPIAGIILQAPPASMLRVLLYGRCCVSRPAEASSCCLDHFDSYTKVNKINVPVLLIHGELDQTVPSSHGKLILNRLPSNKIKPLFLKGAKHDDLENYREVWIRIRKFIRNELSKTHNSNATTTHTETGSRDRTKTERNVKEKSKADRRVKEKSTSDKKSKSKSDRKTKEMSKSDRRIKEKSKSDRKPKEKSKHKTKNPLKKSTEKSTQRSEGKSRKDSKRRNPSPRKEPISRADLNSREPTKSVSRMIDAGPISERRTKSATKTEQQPKTSPKSKEFEQKTVKFVEPPSCARTQDIPVTQETRQDSGSIKLEEKKKKPKRKKRH